MTSIRRRTAALVALSMALMLVAGGVALLIVLRRAMTAQFDEALVARAAALQSLTRFDGTTVEIDFAGEAMPRFAGSATSHAAGADAEFFVVWVRAEAGWRALERSESLRDGSWPPPTLRDGPVGVRDATLPSGALGRVALIEFLAPTEHDEGRERQGERATPLVAVPAADLAAPAPAVRLLVGLPRAPLDRVLSIVGWSIAGVGVALALASVMIVRWAVGRGLRPLTDLSRRVHALGPETLRAGFESAGLPSELRPIAEQLSGLLARLQEAFERETRFSAAASHELRTPIAELRTLLEVAASKPRSGEEWARTTTTALGVLARAQSLGETLLRLSRAGATPSSPEAHARAEVGPILAEQAARAVAVHGGDARRLRIVSADGLFVRATAATLSSIIGNLLDNALRHGEATTQHPVCVRAGAGVRAVDIEITNPAPTLTADDLPRLFEPFWRKNDARGDERGFGLGLAVARALARSDGGDITARLQGANALTLRLVLPTVQECQGPRLVAVEYVGHRVCHPVPEV